MSDYFAYDRADDARYRFDTEAATEILRMLTAEDDPLPLSPDDDGDPFRR